MQEKDVQKKFGKRNVPDVANYDLHPDYHYSAYWAGREYEHKAELLAIKDIFKIIKRGLTKRGIRGTNFLGNVILDLGAGFGRLIPSYCQKFKVKVLGDYSLKELSDAIEYTKKFKCGLKLNGDEPNLFLFGVNAYFLPFVSNVFDVIISVRLSHHIENQEEFLKEVYRVIKPGGFFILEVANKDHIKAFIRNVLHFNFKNIRKKKVKISHNSRTAQGLVNDSQQYVFYNFRVSYITKLAERVGFKTKAFRQVSVLRHPLLKRIIPVSIMLAMEWLYQKASIILNKGRVFLTPSVFILLQKPNLKELNASNENYSANLKHPEAGLIASSLICPKHKKPLNFDVKSNSFQCPSGCSFGAINKYVYDLRFPIITV